MRAFIRYRMMGIAFAMLAVGCRERSRRPEAGAMSPAWLSVSSDRFRRDIPIPFAPIRGEVVPAPLCGAKRRGPCLLLGWEYYNLARGYTHSAWFMDTNGNEYEFSFNLGTRRGGDPESSDPVRLAMEDHLVTQDDVANIVAASTALPGRATAAEVAHALSLVAKSQAGSVETIRSSGCDDGGRSTLSGYVFVTERNGSSPVMLEKVACDFLLNGNDSPAAHELAQWVHRLRGTVTPYRERR